MPRRVPPYVYILFFRAICHAVMVAAGFSPLFAYYITRYAILLLCHYRHATILLLILLFSPVLCRHIIGYYFSPRHWLLFDADIWRPVFFSAIFSIGYALPADACFCYFSPHAMLPLHHYFRYAFSPCPPLLLPFIHAFR